MVGVLHVDERGEGGVDGVVGDGGEDFGVVSAREGLDRGVE